MSPHLEELLNTLNPPQKEAVLTTEGPVMIIAGAGSGKTRVLTFRIAHLLEKGVDPYNILSLTFTNKAAREMRERIEQVVGSNARNLWMGTFHSIFARILRSESNKLGYPTDFTIYDMDDAKSLLKTIVKERNLDEKLYKPNIVLNRISSAKNRLVSWMEYNRNPVYRTDDESQMRPEIGTLYRIYQERLFKSNAMDFDDLLFNTSLLFKDHLDVLNKYQERFKYIMVDEFQDTNLSQYYITRKLSSRYRNIAVVGDDAQSIYAFRGADIQNILNFEKDYDELKVFKLEQNYRSSKTIVEAANSVITRNTAQLKKDVWTANDEGNKINVLVAKSDNEEGRIVANTIFETKMQNSERNSDFAILYRTNAQSRSIEEALRKLGINYKIFGGLSFYHRKEIKDVIAYLRFAMNGNDEQGFKRIFNYPKRGLGSTTEAKVMHFATDQGISIFEALEASPHYLPGRVAGVIENFVIMVKNFRHAMATKDAFEAATQVAKESGLLKELYNDKTVEGLARHENVQELLNGIKEFVDDPEREDKSMGTFLQEISLLTDSDTQDVENDDFVSLMTIHSSKGLEYKHVHIVGLEEDLFPSQMMLASRADLEEERRLFYVAITRAESTLTLSFALSRYRFGTLKSCEQSRFIDEINPNFLNYARKPQIENPDEVISSSFKGNYTSLLNDVKKRNENKGYSQIKKPSTDFKPSDTNLLLVGQTVEHQKFGMGTVVNMDPPNTNSRKAKVNFHNFGEKTLLLSFAKLKIHS